MSGAAIGAAAITAVGAYAAAQSNKGSGSSSTDTATSTSSIPTWSSEQTPYVWGEGYEFPTYQLSDEAKKYGAQLTGGYKGADGTSIAPMNSSDLMASILGTGTDQNKTNYQSLLGVGSTPRLTYDQLFTKSEAEPVVESAAADNSALYDALLRDYVSSRVGTADGGYGTPVEQEHMLGTSVPVSTPFASLGNAYVTDDSGDILPMAYASDPDLKALYDVGVLEGGYDWRQKLGIS